MSTLHKGKGVLLLLALTLTCIMVSQTSHAQYKKKIIRNWINWNGVFREGVDSVKRQFAINNIKGAIVALSAEPIDGVKPYKSKLTSYLKKQIKKQGYRRNQFIIKKITINYCACDDPYLWNITADAEVNQETDTTGPSQPTVAPPKTPTVPQGELLAVLGQNDAINVFTDKIAMLQPDSVLQFSNLSFDDKAVIAILDTGIDTTLFANGMRSEVLWNGPGGSKNMLIGGDPGKYMDDHSYRHGTSVASIALESYYKASKNAKIPRLMVIKVLTGEGSGTIFELSCGLSYAHQNHATVINTSMGYYGVENDVLNYYAEKCHIDSIPIVAAAGNAAGTREPGMECTETIDGNNKLRNPDHLFYPACLAPKKNLYTVIAVTGFKSPGIPCYYQNYSSEFVTMGVLNERTEQLCCMYRLPFINSEFALEGSSFATPVVSGRLTFNIINMGHHSNTAEYLRLMHTAKAPHTSAMPEVTESNQYISY